MLHPNQFRVNEAWIAFKLNDAPLATKSDGDFNWVALMDAASSSRKATRDYLLQGGSNAER